MTVLLQGTDSSNQGNDTLKQRTSKKETGLNPQLMSSSWGSSPWESTGQVKHPKLSQSPHNLQIWQAHFLSGELPTSPCWRRTGCKDPLGDPKRGEDIALGALYRAIITHYRFTRSYPPNPAHTFSQSLRCAGLCTAASQTGGPPPFHPSEIIVLALSIISAKDADGPGFFFFFSLSLTVSLFLNDQLSWFTKTWHSVNCILPSAPGRTTPLSRTYPHLKMHKYLFS